MYIHCQNTLRVYILMELVSFHLKVQFLKYLDSMQAHPRFLHSINTKYICIYMYYIAYITHSG